MGKERVFYAHGGQLLRPRCRIAVSLAFRSCSLWLRAASLRASSEASTFVLKVGVWSVGSEKGSSFSEWVEANGFAVVMVAGEMDELGDVRAKGTRQTQTAS